MEGKAQGSFQARRSPLYSPRNAGSPSCRGKVETSAFRRVTDLVILFIFSAIPLTNIVLHRGHP